MNIIIHLNNESKQSNNFTYQFDKPLLLPQGIMKFSFFEQYIFVTSDFFGAEMVTSCNKNFNGYIKSDIFEHNDNVKRFEQTDKNHMPGEYITKPGLYESISLQFFNTNLEPLDLKTNILRMLIHITSESNDEV